MKTASLKDFKVFAKATYGNSYGVNINLTMPLQDASALRDAKFSLLLVGKVDGVRLLKGRSILKEPKINDPSDFFFSSKGLPFNLTEVILYDKVSGVIIFRQAKAL
jgi:hypothetical protein